MLEVTKLSAGYSPRFRIVEEASFRLERGQFGCVIGANGCGKSTVLKTILGMLPSLGGVVALDGANVLRMSDKERASHFAYIPQAHAIPFPFLVKDMVLMGRTPYLEGCSSPSSEDCEVAFAAMCQMSIEHLADRTFTELSGGQQQLVLIARALAQQPDVLVMDEPTASLDFGNQQLVLSRMRGLVDCGMSVLMVTHDPAHALYCADKVIALHEGEVLAEGSPQEVITSSVMNRIYGIDVRIATIELDDGQVGCACVPVRGREGNRATGVFESILRKRPN